MAMYRCSIRERLTEKLLNCNGFFNTHRYPPFLKFSFNFRQRREALINTDTRRFKIQTSDMGAPPGRASIIPFQDLSGNFFHSKAGDFFKFLSLYKCRKSLTIKTALMSFNWVIVDQTMQKIYTATQRRNSFNRCILTPNFCT